MNNLNPGEFGERLGRNQTDEETVVITCAQGRHLRGLGGRRPPPPEKRKKEKERKKKKEKKRKKKKKERKGNYE